VHDEHSFVIPPDFATGEVGVLLRADPILAAELFDPSNPVFRAHLEEYRQQFVLDDDELEQRMRYAYEKGQRDWLVRRARFDPEQFLRVSDRLGVQIPKRRGRKKMTEDAQAPVRRAVCDAIQRVWSERPDMSLDAVLLVLGHGELDPRTVRDWLKRFQIRE
jgi:hypothetical protein